jgi:hypothetical protein
MNSDYFSIIAFILFVTVVNEQCIFAKYLFYDIINNQYYEYHCSYRNYTAFTNRIVKIIKKSKFITVAFSVLYNIHSWCKQRRPRCFRDWEKLPNCGQNLGEIALVWYCWLALASKESRFLHEDSSTRSFLERLASPPLPPWCSPAAYSRRARRRRRRRGSGYPVAQTAEQWQASGGGTRRYRFSVGVFVILEFLGRVVKIN